MKLLSLMIGNETLEAPRGVPTGGLDTTGGNIIHNSIIILLIVAIIFAIIVLILSGIQWITSGGDKQKIQTARNRIVFTIVGLVIVLGGFFILSLVFRGFGLGGTVVGPSSSSSSNGSSDTCSSDYLGAQCVPAGQCNGTVHPDVTSARCTDTTQVCCTPYTSSVCRYAGDCHSGYTCVASLGSGTCLQVYTGGSGSVCKDPSGLDVQNACAAGLRCTNGTCQQ